MSLKAKHSKLGLPGRYEEKEDTERAARGYIGWCPSDDGLSGKGWGENKEFASWAEFQAEWGTDDDVDMNLIADFYFSMGALRERCPACDRSGYSPRAKVLQDTFYGGWANALTPDELAALEAAGRSRTGGVLGHDALNCSILVEARAKRLGIEPLTCPSCEGSGVKLLEPENLILFVWMLHPRKGCGRGITVRNIADADLPEIKAWVRKSYELHVQHFKWAATEDEKQS